MTGVDIIASAGKPTIKTPKNRSWSKTTIPFMAHGYEELVTPLHMLMLYNAVANGGKNDETLPCTYHKRIWG